MYNSYPIAWIGKSQVFLDFISSMSSVKEFLVADFASGEYDRIPSFFVTLLPEISPASPKRTVVYCIDVHALRLDSLLGKLEESDLLDDARVVHAKLEAMDTEAIFRPDMLEYFESRESIMTKLDHHVKANRFLPEEVFDLGVLNNDMVGYLHEYYSNSSDVTTALQKVHRTLKKGAFLIVTSPCSLYVVDNVKFLEPIGFRFLEGKDVTLSDGSVFDLNRETEPQSMSRLGHYTFLIFVRD